MQNLELKAKYPHIERAFELAGTIGAQQHWTKKQIDSYFSVPNGKLKLRQVENENGELIAYIRPTDQNAKVSDYYIYKTATPTVLKKVLSHVLPFDIDVVKERTLYTWKNVRIHIDNVQGLGGFLEFEVVMNEEKDALSAQENLIFLQSHFQIQPSYLIDCGYYELLKGAVTHA
ncbi:class IV adenylate cyclase [candidate division KSB1 bacterium]|nr:class IV adenylate cyclase [candidate division KSB1 bacterium]